MPTALTLHIIKAYEMFEIHGNAGKLKTHDYAVFLGLSYFVCKVR